MEVYYTVKFFKVGDTQTS